MSTDMGRGILAPDSTDNISSSGVTEMRTIAATTANAIGEAVTEAVSKSELVVRSWRAPEATFSTPQWLGLSGLIPSSGDDGATEFSDMGSGVIKDNEGGRHRGQVSLTFAHGDGVAHIRVTQGALKLAHSSQPLRGGCELTANWTASLIQNANVTISILVTSRIPVPLWKPDVTSLVAVQRL